MKIYTRTGDSGTTGLIGGARIAKNSLRMTAIGDVDELNAAIGMARSHGAGSLDAELATIQNWLFDLGAELASPTEHARQYKAISEAQTARLEESIDRQTEALEPLREFILPGGSSLGAALHLARCICRRAERSILELNAHEPLDRDSLVFVNRLSDWLFVAARTANRLDGVMDVKWQRIGD
ncbi:MAG TPA: cob(I)yrinic acid a,c-diamide adenosyltransferase [Fimbriimonadaceae bacterium]|nr:cob(I)yrinic acid a,c-diamide adenosyltransferase [Fimbriimonadaceae bacterium]